MLLLLLLTHVFNTTYTVLYVAVDKDTTTQYTASSKENDEALHQDFLVILNLENCLFKYLTVGK